MEAYGGFALVYDEMMAERDYEKWVHYVLDLLGPDGNKLSGEVLDIACGTGSFLLEMGKRGWQLFGVDSSEAMLAVSYDKLGSKANLFQQDLRALDLGRQFSLITCMCDSLNYLLDPKELLQVLHLVKKHLASGGVFIADLNSEYKYRYILGDGTFAETFENSAYIWENSYDPETGLCQMEIDFFLRQAGENFRHLHETHLQKAYSQLELVELGRKAGFSQVELWEAFTANRLQPEQEGQLLAQGRFTPRSELEEVPSYESGRMFLVIK